MDLDSDVLSLGGLMPACRPEALPEGLLSLGGLMPACRPEALPEGLQLCNLEYNQWGKHAEYFDQQMGTGHPMWCNKDVKLKTVLDLFPC